MLAKKGRVEHPVPHLGVSLGSSCTARLLEVCAKFSSITRFPASRPAPLPRSTSLCVTKYYKPFNTPTTFKTKPEIIGLSTVAGIVFRKKNWKNHHQKKEMSNTSPNQHNNTSSCKLQDAGVLLKNNSALGALKLTAPEIRLQAIQSIVWKQRAVLQVQCPQRRATVLDGRQTFIGQIHTSCKGKAVKPHPPQSNKSLYSTVSDGKTRDI